MDDRLQWEYRVDIVGSTLSTMKSEDLQAILNEWGEEGWELVSIFLLEHSSKMHAGNLSAFHESAVNVKDGAVGGLFGIDDSRIDIGGGLLSSVELAYDRASGTPTATPSS